MTSLSFVHETLPQRVVFGPGRRSELGAELARLGASAVFVVADGAASDAAADMTSHLTGVDVTTWSDVVQHVPAELAGRARAAVDEARPDVVVCIGGGSSVGLAKAIALTHHLPILAVPTTYAGSEQTTIYGLTDDRHKQTGKDPIVLPRVVIYDAELTVGLPPNVTGPSAFNALAHSVEALYAPGHDPVTTALALEGVRAIHEALPIVMASPADIEARATLQYGAYLSGMALGATAAGFHHKICHVLGGTFDLVHADAHSVVLPHAIAFNAPALPVEMRRLAAALDTDDDPAGALWDLARRSAVPTSLAELGLARDDLAEAARRAAQEITDNPRPFDESDVLGLLQRAHDGARPTTD